MREAKRGSESDESLYLMREVLCNFVFVRIDLSTPLLEQLNTCTGCTLMNRIAVNRAAIGSPCII